MVWKRKKIKSEIIFEEERSIVILDVDPLSKGHSLIITKKHYDNLTEININDWESVFVSFKKTIEILNKKYKPKGFNFISNIGKCASQKVEHLHIHIIPKYEKNEGFVWPEKKK